MKRVNQFHFYLLGAAIHPLTQIRDGATLGEMWVPCLQAQGWLTSLLGDRLTPIITCQSTAKKLLEALQRVTSVVNVSPSPSPEQYSEQMALPVSWFEVVGVVSAAREFETVFSAELETTDTYYVSEKGIYSTGRLIEHAEQSFSAGVQAELSPQAIEDIRQAGKCLAFDLDTACGFHMVRATKNLVHRYYVRVTGATPKRKDRNWGAYVCNLNKHRKDDPESQVDPKLVSLIDQVREHHRNPVIHPEITLTPDEAQSLFSMCQAVIITGAGALTSLKGAQVPSRDVATTLRGASLSQAVRCRRVRSRHSVSTHQSTHGPGRRTRRLQKETPSSFRRSWCALA